MRSERGQSLLETVIVMPILIFLILGALQLMLIAHTRVMAEYAAFCAVRAGIVNNGDWNVMRNAALIGALPVYMRTDDVPHFLASWAKVKAAAEITDAVDSGVATLEYVGADFFNVDLAGITQDLSIIDLHVTSPTQSDYDGARATYASSSSSLTYPEDGREIDFDDVNFIESRPDAGRLAVELRLLYPLRIPFVSKMFFELWLAQETLNVHYVHSDLQGWVTGRATVGDGDAAGQEISDAVGTAHLQGVGNSVETTQWSEEVRTLRWIADEYGLYLLPIRSSYAMQLQSNAYRQNRREPTWFTLPEGSHAWD